MNRHILGSSIVCVGAGALLFGCASQLPARDYAKMSPPERQAALNEITKRCDLPFDRLQMLTGTDVKFRPGPRDDYNAVNCTLKELRKLRGKALGFIGNEAPAEKVN